MHEIEMFRILEGATAIYETLVVYQFVSGLFEQKKRSTLLLVVYALFGLNLSLLSVYVRTPIILISFTLIALYGIEFLCYKTTYQMRCFSALYFVTAMMTSEVICSSVVSRIWGVDLAATLELGFPRATGMIAVKLIQGLLVQFSVTLAKWKKVASNKNNVQGFVPIIFSQICFLYLSYIGFSFCFYYCKKLNLAAVGSMIGIMYANGIIFWYFDRIYAASNYLEKNKSLERELLLQKEYHEALLAQQVAADALWHDIKKHLSLAKELMRFEGSYASNAYIDDLEADLKRSLQVVRTDQPVIGALLTEQIKRAAKENVVLNLDIHLMPQIRISATDACIIFGNIFENAFQACEVLAKGENRWINAEIKQRDQCVVIRITNPKPLQETRTVRSGKHGIGLKNVKKAVAKYGGFLHIGDDNNRFSVTILIP